jgi:hypothetical protein
MTCMRVPSDECLDARERIRRRSTDGLKVTVENARDQPLAPGLNGFAERAELMRVEETGCIGFPTIGPGLSTYMPAQVHECEPTLPGCRKFLNTQQRFHLGADSTLFPSLAQYRLSRRLTRLEPTPWNGPLSLQRVAGRLSYQKDAIAIRYDRSDADDGLRSHATQDNSRTRAGS